VGALSVSECYSIRASLEVESIQRNFRVIMTQFFKNLLEKSSNYQRFKRIWYEWEIVDNKFVSMVMLNGDDCGSSGTRRTKVYFNCNSNLAKTQIEEVSEPETCNYKIVLSSPLVCEQSDKDIYTNTMNVYPWLSERLKSEWDHAYSELNSGFITEKVFGF